MFDCCLVVVGHFSLAGWWLVVGWLLLVIDRWSMVVGDWSMIDDRWSSVLGGRWCSVVVA